jgi:hypothetical protein
MTHMWPKLYCVIIITTIVTLGSSKANSHEISMAVLSLKEMQQGQFIVHWLLTPGGNILNTGITFPRHCTFEPPQLDCGANGLVGKISFKGLGKKQSATLVRVTRKDGSTVNYTLTSAQPSVTIVEGKAGWIHAGLTYLPLGIEHILLGLDHLLFVFGLIWIVSSPWMLVKTITAFTIAHTITLAAATLGWVGVPERPVNAAIALSIVFVAIEVLKIQRGELSLTTRFPWLVAFAFGLLHGFGFAGALTKLGLPQSNIPLALLFFNVGVEIGQISFVLLVLALQWSHRTVEVRLPRWTEPIPAYVIGSFAMFWFINRFTMIIYR